MSEEVTKKKSSKKVLAIVLPIVAIVVIAVIAGVCVFMYHMQQINLLNEEGAKILQASSMAGTGNVQIDMELKTKGSYRVVEETLKNYMNEAATLSNDVGNVYDEKALRELLSVENMENDGPEFKETKEKLAKMRTETEEYVDKFIVLCSEENLLNAIEDKGVGAYYKELYRKLAVDDKTSRELLKVGEDLKEAKELVSETFDYVENIINFLSENPTDWTVQGTRVMFTDNSKLTEYNKIVLDTPGR